jgi:hypothetical protein
MSKNKKPILFDDIEWGNQELPHLSHDEIMDPVWRLRPNKADKEKTHKVNLKNYGQGEYILRSPGNDLLDFYDKKMLLLDPTSKAFSKIPPSVVYHYRFKHHYPKELFDKSKNYGRNAYLRDILKKYHDTKDPTYWSQVYKTRFKWLIDKPHKEWKFKFKSDLNKFALELLGQKIGHKLSTQSYSNNLKNKNSETMFWRGNIAGWSIIYEE